MRENVINFEIVESARIFGQWLNKTADAVARNKVKEKQNGLDKIKKIKAKILMQIENDIVNAKTPQDMLFRTSISAGKMLQEDVPVKAARFIDAVNSGEEISFDEARQLLMLYMRLQHGDLK